MSTHAQIDVHNLLRIEEARDTDWVPQPRRNYHPPVLSLAPTGEKALPGGVEPEPLPLKRIVETYLSTVRMTAEDQVCFGRDEADILRMVAEQDVVAAI